MVAKTSEGPGPVGVAAVDKGRHIHGIRIIVGFDIIFSRSSLERSCRLPLLLCLRGRRKLGALSFGEDS